MKPSTVKTLAVLKDGQWHSDYNLIERVRATQASRRLRELRAQGYMIEKRRIRLTSGKVSHAYEYRLLACPEPLVLTVAGGPASSDAGRERPLILPPALTDSHDRLFT